MYRKRLVDIDVLQLYDDILVELHICISNYFERFS